MTIVGTNISMVRGDTEAMTVSCTENGVARAFVTGDKVYFTVKKTVSETEKILQKVITTFTDGKAHIDILPSDTKALACKSYIYDIQIVFADGTVKTIIGPSTFDLTSEVTYD